MRKLYIIVRTDLDSMTPGRIAAQASHASNFFVGHVNLLTMFENDTPTWAENNTRKIKETFLEWQSETNQYFGTVIVLNGGSSEEIKNRIENLDPTRYVAENVIDPEYPIRDGQVTWVLPNVHTCSFAFCYNGEDNQLRDLKLL